MDQKGVRSFQHHKDLRTKVDHPPIRVQWGPERFQFAKYRQLLALWENSHLLDACFGNNARWFIAVSSEELLWYIFSAEWRVLLRPTIIRILRRTDVFHNYLYYFILRILRCEWYYLGLRYAHKKPHRHPTYLELTSNVVMSCAIFWYDERPSLQLRVFNACIVQEKCWSWPLLDCQISSGSRLWYVLWYQPTNLLVFGRFSSL